MAPIKVTPPKRRRMSPLVAAHIKRLKRDTNLHQHEIAAMLGINQGRVSEVLSGQRYAEVSPDGFRQFDFFGGAFHG